MKLLAFGTVLLLFFGHAQALDTYYLDEYCGNTIDMIVVDEFAERLSIDGSYVGDCNVTLQTWYSANRISFYFENFDLGLWEVDCLDTFLTVFDGPNAQFSPEMHGLQKVCGNRKPDGAFFSNSRDITFRYFNHGKKPNDNKVDIIVTSFHNGICNNYEYECSNGHCIDDSVNCNGYNPCGDNSDCRLGTATVVGIVAGSIFVICVSVACVLVIRRNRRNGYNTFGGNMNQMRTPFEVSPYEVSSTTVVRATSPHPSYGIAQQYSAPTSYNMPTSIQGDK